MSKVDALEVAVYRVPTDEPESDGTFTWTATTAVVVQVFAAGLTGLGYTYGTSACADIVGQELEPAVVGADALDVTRIWADMVGAVRNVGRPGPTSMAIAAVDTALWDLKARLLEQPLVRLLGQVHDEVAVYGSGGFTSYTDTELTEQLGGWVEQGIPRVKLKVGTAWGSRGQRDVERVAVARRAIGPEAELYVDANGGYTRKQAVRISQRFAEQGVTWFEEPVSSDDLDGLAEIRRQIPADVAAGEYGFDLTYFERMCAAGAVDVLQVDVSRCGGITEWLRAAAVAAAHGLQVSGHCAPALHLHVACATPNIRHLEYFHDHVRVEQLLFDGVPEPAGGSLRPDLTRTGGGLDLKASAAEQYRQR